MGWERSDRVGHAVHYNPNDEGTPRSTYIYAVVLRERSEDPVVVDVYGAAIQANAVEPLGQLQISDYDGCGPAPDDLLLAAPDLTACAGPS